MPQPRKTSSSPKSKLTDAVSRVRELERQISAIVHETQEKVVQLETLNQSASLLNASLDLSAVQERAIQFTCQLVGCEGALLFFVDRDRGELVMDRVGGARLAIDDRSIVGHVAMSAEGVLINDVQAMPSSRRACEAFASFPVRTLIAVPLVAKGQVVGVLQALNKLTAAPKRPSRHAWADFHETDKQLLETLGHQVASALENSRLYSALKKNFHDTVEALAEAIEKKDRYTGGHTKRVVYFSVRIAKYMNLTPEELENVKLAAILHDVGKIGIEDKILKKGSALDQAEWAIMQTHPELGYDIMRRVEGLKDVVGGMRFHHERWDGKGYPLGLKGTEIPLVARIVAVADAYDAMVSTRPYRKGSDPRFSHDELVKQSGTQFDPAVIEAFQEAFKREKMGRGSG